MNRGKNRNRERERETKNGEEIYAKNSMKLEGVQACMPAVIIDAAFS